MYSEPNDPSDLDRITREAAEQAKATQKANGHLPEGAPPEDITAQYRTDKARTEPAELDDVAYHGPLGSIARAIEPETEASPAAILTQGLIQFGNAVGRGPYLKIGHSSHHANEFLVNVGDTAKARKGMSYSSSSSIMARVDEHWSRECRDSGLSSGEGLIARIGDPIEITKTDKKGNETTTTIFEGVDDKRLMVFEPEFASVLKSAERKGSILSEKVRDAWDSPLVLGTMTKNSRMVATEPHISIVAHVTVEELTRTLTDTAIANGFANRFIFVYSKRERELPFGGQEPDYGDAFDQLRTSYNRARTVKSVGWTHRRAGGVGSCLQRSERGQAWIGGLSHGPQ